jgi:hypothetical protein
MEFALTQQLDAKADKDLQPSLIFEGKTFSLSALTKCSTCLRFGLINNYLTKLKILTKNKTF